MTTPSATVTPTSTPTPSTGAAHSQIETATDTGTGSIDSARAAAEQSESIRSRKANQEEQVRARTKQRLEELQENKRSEQQAEQERNALRDRIHPEILRRAQPVRSRPVSLIRLFHPKTRVSYTAKRKEVLKAFKRALANFHPDRTVNQSLEQQITAEEIFKLLSTEKEKYENAKGKAAGAMHYNPRHGAPRRRQGWF